MDQKRQLLSATFWVSVPIAVPYVRSESLEKWKGELSDEQIVQIQDVVGTPVS